MVEQENKTCANCRRELHLGVDAIKLTVGVMGLKGLVPLEEALLFCCEKCLREYHDLGDLPSVPKRIP